MSAFDHRRIRLIKHKVATFLVAVVASSSTMDVHASDCAEAKRLYKRAKQTSSIVERLKLLERSLNMCKSYEGYYTKGEALEQQRRWREAGWAFRKAANSHYALSPEGVSLGREQDAIGRAAENYAQLGDGCNADVFYQKAKSVVNRTPQRIERSYRDFLAARAKRIVTAQEIACVLSEKRNIGVTPAIDLHSIHFDFDSAVLKGSARSQVYELGKALSKKKGKSAKKRVRLVGHTDERGTPEYNMNLSVRRARAVAEELNQRFPGLADRLVVVGRGLEEPIVPAARSDADHQLNRRVETQLE